MRTAIRFPIRRVLAGLRHARRAGGDTPRGHKSPYAFLERTAGLSRVPYGFAHIDIGGAAVAPADWQFGRPTGSPILAFTSWLERASR